MARSRSAMVMAAKLLEPTATAMSAHHVLTFDRPLVAAQLTIGAERVHTVAELHAARAAGFLAGGDAARAFSAEQLVELRAEFQALQHGLFQGLIAAHDQLLGEVRTALPELTVELGRRLLADFVPPPELVERLCRSALDQLYPERDGLELVVSPADAASLNRLQPSWSVQFTNLRITIDDTLNPGDCLVRSRFGVTDARASAKIEALSHEVLGP